MARDEHHALRAPRRLLSVGVGTLLTLGAWGAAPLAETETAQAVAVDAADCATFLRDARAAAARLTPWQRLRLRVATVKDCRWVTTVEPAPVVQTVKATHARIRCGGFWKKQGLEILNFPILVAHVNVGFCWNYHKAWGGAVYGPPQWGPDCYVSTPIYHVSKSWCGIWNNNRWHTEPGMNFAVAPWTWPWAWRNCHVRYVVRGDGASSGMWGGCD